MGVCNGSFASCVALMFASVNFMDNIYTTSKFVDSHRTYLGIGFRVGEISLYRAYSEQPSDFNYTNLTHFNYNTKWTASDRLASFGMYLSILTYKKRFCAHHLFTNYPHPGQILGIAYTRTLCYPGIDKPGFPKINVAISSATDNKAGPITTLQMNLVFAHEMGHLFGAEHDQNTTKCAKPEQLGGNFIMDRYSVTGRYPNNLKFSPCSLRAIGLHILEYSCLVPRSYVPFCGNGAVEDEEYCDASSHGMDDMDPCCDKNCKLRGNATCSDTNHFCCKNCVIAPANTPCLHGEPVDCTKPSFCTGREFSCPTPAFVPDGTRCPGPGHCYSGKCLSFCQELSRNRSVRLQACMCRTNDHGAACKKCCFNTESANVSYSCKVYSRESVDDGTPCYMGFCKTGLCEASDEPTIKRLAAVVEVLRKSELDTFIRDHLVMCLGLIGLVIWLPAVFFLYKADASNKRMLKPKAAKERRKRRHRERKVRLALQNTDSGLFLTSPVMADIKSDSMEADTYSQRVRQLSGSFLSFISEAGRIFTGRTAGSHKAAVTEEARLEGDAVDKFPIIVVNKATRSEPENVQISVEDKVGMMVIYEDSVAEDKSQSDLADKSHSDLASQLHSDLADKSHSDKASQSHKVPADKSHSDLAAQFHNDLAKRLQNDLGNTSQSDIGNAPHSDLADRAPGNRAKKARVLMDKLRNDEGNIAHSDVTASSHTSTGRHNTQNDEVNKTR